MIVIYQSCFVLNFAILVNFWITELTNDEFLVYTGSGGDLFWDLITTVPFILILIEYPFNQIPISWGMLLFDLLLINVYVALNIVIVTFRSEHEPIYEDFDWYHKPWRSLGSYFCLLGIAFVVFAALWAYTMLLKLPAYREKDDEKLGGEFKNERCADNATLKITKS